MLPNQLEHDKAAETRTIEEQMSDNTDINGRVDEVLDDLITKIGLDRLREKVKTIMEKAMQNNIGMITDMLGDLQYRMRRIEDIQMERLREEGRHGKRKTVEATQGECQAEERPRKAA